MTSVAAAATGGFGFLRWSMMLLLPFVVVVAVPAAYLPVCITAGFTATEEEEMLRPLLPPPKPEVLGTSGACSREVAVAEGTALEVVVVVPVPVP